MDPPPSQKHTSTPDSNTISPIHDEDCSFCQIISTYDPVSPLDPSYPESPSLDPDKLYPPAFVLLSTEHVVAFLDIFPLVRGHVLLCPRRHAEKVGDMSAREGMEIGRILPLLSRAVTRATMPEIPHAEVDYNVVQNNGPGAAQVVPHTHFHFIPRYPFDSTYTPYTSQPPPQAPTSSTADKPRQIPQGIAATAILFGRGQRHYRDDDDAAGLVQVLRREVAREWRAEFGDGAASPEAAADGVEKAVGSGDDGARVSERERRTVAVVKESDEAALPLRAKGGGVGRGGGRL